MKFEQNIIDLSCKDFVTTKSLRCIVLFLYFGWRRRSPSAKKGKGRMIVQCNIHLVKLIFNMDLRKVENTSGVTHSITLSKWNVLVRPPTIIPSLK